MVDNQPKYIMLMINRTGIGRYRKMKKDFKWQNDVERYDRPNIQISLLFRFRKIIFHSYPVAPLSGNVNNFMSIFHPLYII